MVKNSKVSDSKLTVIEGFKEFYENSNGKRLCVVREVTNLDLLKEFKEAEKRCNTEYEFNICNCGAVKLMHTPILELMKKGKAKVFVEVKSNE